MKSELCFLLWFIFFQTAYQDLPYYCLPSFFYLLALMTQQIKLIALALQFSRFITSLHLKQFVNQKDQRPNLLLHYLSQSFCLHLLQRFMVSSYQLVKPMAFTIKAVSYYLLVLSFLLSLFSVILVHLIFLKLLKNCCRQNFVLQIAPQVFQIASADMRLLKHLCHLCLNQKLQNRPDFFQSLKNIFSNWMTLKGFVFPIIFT